jgi:hypothetical protein
MPDHTTRAGRAEQREAPNERVQQRHDAEAGAHKAAADRHEEAAEMQRRHEAHEREADARGDG